MTDLGIGAVAAAAYRGELPDRYHGYPKSFHAPFRHAVNAVLAPNQRILDVGSGRKATIDPADRPAGCWYVGSDILPDELAVAPPGSYDDTAVTDIVRFDPALEGAFDLIVSFQVLEHVRPLPEAMENMRRYLRPGGCLVVQFSGAFGAYSVVARATPRRLTEWAQSRLYDRHPDTVFRPTYDRCWFGALEKMLQPWTDATITPLWIAESYFHFSPVLRSAYMAYEEWARRGRRLNVAPYYLVTAIR